MSEDFGLTMITDHGELVRKSNNPRSHTVCSDQNASFPKCPCISLHFLDQLLIILDQRRKDGYILEAVGQTAAALPRGFHLDLKAIPGSVVGRPK